MIDSNSDDLSTRSPAPFGALLESNEFLSFKDPSLESATSISWITSYMTFLLDFSFSVEGCLSLFFFLDLSLTFLSLGGDSSWLDRDKFLGGDLSGLMMLIKQFGESPIPCTLGLNVFLPLDGLLLFEWKSALLSMSSWRV